MSTLSVTKSNTPKCTVSTKGSSKSNTTARPEVSFTAADAEKSSNHTSAALKKTAANSNPAPRCRAAPPITTVAKTSPQAINTSLEAAEAHESKFESATKQDRTLRLLSRREGASIEEMRQATNWQKHSVRGFLAGTVKKKLGFSLASFKPDNGARRYHIATHRAL